jgi:hypothetical protein
VRYAVAGGLAVGLHGYIRATEDMDFLVHPSDVPQLEVVLAQLGYRANPAEQELTNAGLKLRRFFKHLPNEDELMLVDVLIPTSVRMRRVLTRAVPVPYGKGVLSVVSRRDLVMMKQLRGSLSDAADIAFLRKRQ